MKNILITGASRGIGKFFADAYSVDNNVISLSSKDIDFKKDFQPPVFLKEMTYDTVILNAGITNSYLKATIGKSDWETLISVNALNQIRFLHELLPNISGKIAIISSNSGSIYHIQNVRNPQFDDLGYNLSKYILNMLGVWISKKVNIPVVLLHPGSIHTSAPFIEGKKYLNGIDTVNKMINLIENLTMKDTGKFIRYDKKIMCW
jgi:NAD(P)-dependent dehydrogenase (short-subunit alcohol dehydrogenase family)